MPWPLYPWPREPASIVQDIYVNKITVKMYKNNTIKINGSATSRCIN
jgi:hypothetical protein